MQVGSTSSVNDGNGQSCHGDKGDGTGYVRRPWILARICGLKGAARPDCEEEQDVRHLNTNFSIGSR